jgi:hypothetical protein
VVHGILAIFFLLFGSWHAVDLGRHMTLVLAAYFATSILVGVFFLLRTYLTASKPKGMVEVTT